jgi:shikimate dehydrogenase
MDRYCVFGNPIAHSKSPEIHAAFAAQTGQDLQYERRLAPLDGFADAVRAFMAEGGKGANVTVPFKLEAVKLAQALTIRARAAGAVNTLVFSGTASSATTPMARAGGGHRAQRRRADHRQARAAAGRGRRGARRGAADAGASSGRLVIANRTVAKAEELVEQFAALGGEGVVGLRLCRH